MAIKAIEIINTKIKKYFGEDEIGNLNSFRLKVSFLVSIGFGLITPVIITLKGMYIPTFAISILMIAQTLSVKWNENLIKKFTIYDFFKFGIIIHGIYILVGFLYFYNPEVMIWIDSFVAIIEVLIFSSFSILLNTYITDNTPEVMSKFQIRRNGIGADSFIIGLGLSSLITWAFDINICILSYIFYNIFFIIFMIRNSYIYKNCKYCNKIHKI